MKKLFTIATIAFTALFNVYAAGPYKFEKDAEGEYFLSGEFQIECSSETAWKRLLDHINTTFITEMNEISINESTQTVSISGCRENSKFLYNPFAGSFADDVLYELTISINGDIVKYTFTKLYLLSTASGFVNYNKKFPWRVIIRNYQKALELVDDSTLSKKEKKDALHDLKDYESSLDKAQETLLKRADEIKTNIQ